MIAPLTSCLPSYVGGVVTIGVSLFEKIRGVVYPYFTAGTGLYRCGFGTTEITQSIANDQSGRVATVGKDTLTPSNTYLNVHGGLMAGTGICSALEAMNTFGWINYGKLASTVCTAGSVFFLYANIFALQENIRIYEALEKEPDDTAYWPKMAAVWGILSNIGYIIATAALLIGAPAAIALTIGIIASFTGALKILCDFIQWTIPYAGKL